MEVIYFYKMNEENIPIVVERANDLSYTLLYQDHLKEIEQQYPQSRNNLYALVNETVFRLNV